MKVNKQMTDNQNKNLFTYDRCKTWRIQSDKKVSSNESLYFFCQNKQLGEFLCCWWWLLFLELGGWTTIYGCTKEQLFITDAHYTRASRSQRSWLFSRFGASYHFKSNCFVNSYDLKMNYNPKFGFRSRLNVVLT